MCETRDYAHSVQLRQLLQTKFQKFEFENFPEEPFEMIHS